MRQSINTWPEIIAKLRCGDAAYELARNCILADIDIASSCPRIWLVADTAYAKAMTSDHAEHALESALSKYFGVPKLRLLVTGSIA